jgi:hypothetical protein
MTTRLVVIRSTSRKALDNVIVFLIERGVSIAERGLTCDRLCDMQVNSVVVKYPVEIQTLWRDTIRSKGVCFLQHRFCDIDHAERFFHVPANTSAIRKVVEGRIWSSESTSSWLLNVPWFIESHRPEHSNSQTAVTITYQRFV